MSDGRIAPRKRVLKSGVIDLGAGGTIACVVRNLSETGAALEVMTPLFIPDRFTLLVQTEHLNRRCEIVWRKDRRWGVSFH